MVHRFPERITMAEIAAASTWRILSMGNKGGLQGNRRGGWRKTGKCKKGGM